MQSEARKPYVEMTATVVIVISPIYRRLDNVRKKLERL